MRAFIAIRIVLQEFCLAICAADRCSTAYQLEVEIGKFSDLRGFVCHGQQVLRRENVSMVVCDFQRLLDFAASPDFVLQGDARIDLAVEFTRNFQAHVQYLVSDGKTSKRVYQALFSGIGIFSRYGNTSIMNAKKSNDTPAAGNQLLNKASISGVSDSTGLM
jgi:hypothetical protein